MEKLKNDGGPAFPRFVPDGHYNGSVDEQGMTLRDLFAAKAMQGMLAQDRTWSEGAFQEQLALTAFGIADAMLRARGA